MKTPNEARPKQIAAVAAVNNTKRFLVTSDAILTSGICSVIKLPNRFAYVPIIGVDLKRVYISKHRTLESLLVPATAYYSSTTKLSLINLTVF